MTKEHDLPDLGFAVDALEPYLDAATVQAHHARHHAGYVEALNAALSDAPMLQGLAVEDLLGDLASLPEDLIASVRNFGGGHANHKLYFRTLGAKQGEEAKGPLAKAIAKDFGSFSAFRKRLTAAAQTRFGSGWAWLCLNRAERLLVITTPNQDSPLSEGLQPIVGVDVWEHAYTAQYQERRDSYIEAWWQVINWEAVAAIFDDAKKA